jgi:hypothetical protein
MKKASFQLDDGTTVPVVLISPADLDDGLGAADALQQEEPTPAVAQ